MGTYRPLFSVSVAHDYFSDGEWKGLDFVPAPGTVKVIEGADVLVRRTNSGVGVFYSEDRADALRLYAEDTNGVLRFSFKVYSGDRAFANYTALPMRKGDAILSLDNREAVSDSENGRVRLSKDDFVSEKDFKEMDVLVAEDILCEREKRIPPDFVVDVFIKPGKADDEVVPVPPDCYVKFNARQSFWRYFLLGDRNRNSPFIVDLDNRVEFESCGEVVLPGNRPAKVFRSKESLPVLEKSTYRFQLREQGQGGGRVLIKRLPVASESRLGMDVINGKNEIVLDAYVTC